MIGVGALASDGDVPDFSNRDAVYNDIAAPGDGHLLDSSRAALDRSARRRARQGYSTAAPDEYRHAEGTSFAAPQVAAAAALLLGQRPT